MSKQIFMTQSGSMFDSAARKKRLAANRKKRIAAMTDNEDEDDDDDSEVDEDEDEVDFDEDEDDDEYEGDEDDSELDDEFVDNEVLELPDMTFDTDEDSSGRLGAVRVGLPGSSRPRPAASGQRFSTWTTGGRSAHAQPSAF